jgi:hypothetical protein
MDTTIPQTKEAAVALFSLIDEARKANADGKITPYEVVAILVGNAGKLWAAAKDIKLAPSEMVPLTPEKLDELYFTVIDALALEDDQATRAKVGATFDLLRQGLVTFLAWSDDAVA